MSSTPVHTPASTDPASSGSSRHETLDDALVAIRRVPLRPGYRARLLEGLPDRVGLATLRLLRTVQRHDGPPAIGAVAEVLTIDPSTASRMIDRGAASGLLERRACIEDRRRVRLHLTPAGTDLFDKATERRRELLTEVTVDWDDDAIDHLVDRLTRLIAGFDQLEGNA